MATLASLAIELTANSAKMVNELQKANGKLTNFEKTAKTVGTAVKGALVAATTGIFANMVRESIAAGAELTKFAKLANTSTADFQRLASETRKVGIEQDKLADILKDTTDKIGDFIATGGGAAVDFFENIAPVVGVTADEFKNLSGADALGLYIDSLKRANISQAEMTFYMEAIASDATALIPIFDRNSEAAKRLSVILTDVELENLNKANEAIADATTAVGRLGDKMVASLAPAIESATQKLIKFFTTMSSEGDSVPVLEQRLIDLNAKLASIGSGRNAIMLRQGITKQIEELNKQLEAAKALSGDAEAIESQRLITTAKLLELKTKLEEVDGAGRSANARREAIRGEISALTDYQAKLIEVAETKAAVTPEENKADYGGANRDLDSIMKGSMGDSLFGFEGGEDPLTRVLGANPEAVRERLENYLATESELVKMDFVKRQDELLALRQKGEIDKVKYEQLSLKNTQKFNRDMVKACKVKNQAIYSCDEQRMRMTLSATAAFFGVMAAKNKKFAIAQALINTYLGVSESLSAYPMPLAAIMAATHLAAGMQTVNSIRSGGGGGGSGGGASISTSTVTGINDSAESFIEQSTTVESAQQSVLDVNINIDNEALLTKNQLQQIMEQINDAAENRRVRINI